MNSISKAVTTRTSKRVEGIVFVDNTTGEKLTAPDPKAPKEADVRSKKSKGTGMTPATEGQLTALAAKFSK